MQSNQSTAAPSTPIHREGGLSIDSEQAEDFLRRHFHPDSSAVAEIGAGAWSRCFGFRAGGEKLVVRFGRYLDDFQKDQRASRYATPYLPIPQVLVLGRAFDGYYAVSTRCYGDFLDYLDAQQWLAVIPSVVDALEVMRLADLSGTSGYGGWDASGHAPQAKWSGHLLRVADDSPERRNHGWRALLASAPEDDAIFTWGFERLGSLTDVIDRSAPRSLYHADLMNRNVLVEGERITGVFDWGCSCYGDHLYDLAWFEFWLPWYPHLEIARLRLALEDRWRQIGYTPAHLTERLQACYLHIGLDHLAYNAWLQDWPTLSATARRMRALVENS